MPHATPAARNPARRGDAAVNHLGGANAAKLRSGDGRPTGGRLRDAVTRHSRSGSTIAFWPHRPEQRARQAVGRDLLRQPQVRHDREVLTDEEPRVVRERTERLEPRCLCARAAARRPAARPARRGGIPRTPPAIGLRRPRSDSGASSAHAVISPSTSQTMKRFACRRSSSSSRGRRCPSLLVRADQRVQRLGISRGRGSYRQIGQLGLSDVDLRSGRSTFRSTLQNADRFVDVTFRDDVRRQQSHDVRRRAVDEQPAFERRVDDRRRVAT